MSKNAPSHQPQQAADLAATHVTQPAQRPESGANGDHDTVARLTAERDRLQDELERVRAELARTAAALREVSEERDTYRHEVIHLLRDPNPPSEEEWAEIIKNSTISFEETLREFGIDVSHKD